MKLCNRKDRTQDYRLAYVTTLASTHYHSGGNPWAVWLGRETSCPYRLAPEYGWAFIPTVSAAHENISSASMPANGKTWSWPLVPVKRKHLSCWRVQLWIWGALEGLAPVCKCPQQWNSRFSHTPELKNKVLHYHQVKYEIVYAILQNLPNCEKEWHILEVEGNNTRNNWFIQVSKSYGINWHDHWQYYILGKINKIIKYHCKVVQCYSLCAIIIRVILHAMSMGWKEAKK
jgi:hypothetical protein